MSNVGVPEAMSLSTMRAWKSALEQLGAEGDLELLRLVVAQRQRQEDGNQTNSLTPDQVVMIEGLTGIKAEYAAPVNLG